MYIPGLKLGRVNPYISRSDGSLFSGSCTSNFVEHRHIHTSTAI